jgi:hypothetical protein
VDATAPFSGFPGRGPSLRLADNGGLPRGGSSIGNGGCAGGRANGVARRSGRLSVDEGSWTADSGATLTSGSSAVEEGSGTTSSDATSTWVVRFGNGAVAAGVARGGSGRWHLAERRRLAALDEAQEEATNGVPSKIDLNF